MTVVLSLVNCDLYEQLNIQAFSHHKGYIIGRCKFKHFLGYTVNNSHVVCVNNDCCNVSMQLKTIECMDVAEQSLHALELLSHKHSKVILQAVINFLIQMKHLVLR